MTPAPLPDLPAACPMCAQYGHMIRTAEYRGETELEQALTNSLARCQAKHATQPGRLKAVPPQPEEDKDG